MTMNERKPEYLVVLDEYAYKGFKKGYYPDMDNLDLRKTEVVSNEDFDKSKYPVNKDPLSDSTTIYVKDPYFDKYITFDEGLPKLLIDSKSIALVTALEIMGAKDIELAEYVSEQNLQESHQKSDAEGDATGKKIKGGINSNEKSSCLSEIRTIVESHNPKNKQTYDEIFDFIQSHNLGNETTLMTWLGILKRDNKLSGERFISVEFYSELSGMTDFSAQLELKVPFFKAKGGVSYSEDFKKIKKFTTTLKVNFG